LLLVFAIRDILFLQWCMLTRMKNPVSKGVGLLFLYYIAVVLLSSVFGRHDYGGKVPAGLAIFTPAAVFNQGKIQGDAVFGLVLQSLVILVLLVLINERLASRPKAMAAAAASS